MSMDFIKISPKGDITIKSNTTVNWVRAKRIITVIWYEENLMGVVACDIKKKNFAFLLNKDNGLFLSEADRQLMHASHIAILE
jgi:hypothetical protein